VKLTLDEIIAKLTTKTWYGEGEISIQQTQTWKNKLQRYEGMHFVVRFDRHKGRGRGYGMGLTLRDALEDALRREEALEKGDPRYKGYDPSEGPVDGSPDNGTTGGDT
jgi:hypothetical protein